MGRIRPPRNGNPQAAARSQSWIVDANASGDWAGHEASIALWTPGGWAFIEPVEGMLAFDKSATQLVVYSDSWVKSVAPANPQGGATVDAEARAAIEGLIAALRDFGVFPNT
ncbi:DUF2793 domain-containing protein [Altererythrobacter sp. GH1-8]|uniref:DUF2793 domain-containing protein n=1 Tax=Altererythrobacter sp. GH1-8 TaxID=3349333 RepID=UPI00374C9837